MHTDLNGYFQVDIDLAVAAAKRAFHRNSEWRQLDASQRGEIIRKFSDLLERDAKYIAELESYNNGTVLAYLPMFVAFTVNSARYIAACADKIKGDTLPAGKNKIRAVINESRDSFAPIWLSTSLVCCQQTVRCSHTP